MKKFFLMIIAVVVISSGCQNEADVDIMTTTNPLRVITKAAVKEEVSVSSIIPQGSDYHHYEPSAKELARVYRAKYFLCVGEASEPFVKTIKANAPSSLKIIEMSRFLKDNQNFDANDPHFWLSPLASMLVMDIINNNVSNDIGVNINYQNNYNLLSDLSYQYQTVSDNNNQAPIIVDHDGLAYLQLDYNFNVINIYGKNEEQEPSSQDIANLVTMIKANGITTIYCFEYNSHIKIVDTIEHETGVNVATLDTLLKVENFDSYLTGLTSNLEQFQKVK